jgi:hypothetical protein
MEGAYLAARVGACFSFHEYFARLKHREAIGPDIVQAYEEAFVPSRLQPTPECNVALYGACATREKDAKACWETFIGIPPILSNCPLVSHMRQNILAPSFSGTASRCKDRLLHLRDKYQVDEFVLQCVETDLGRKIRAYQLIAEAMYA